MKGHNGILYTDHYEPDSIINGLGQAIPATAKVPLNTWGKADYYMVDPSGNERMIERKQLSEALSDLDAVEEQLGRHLHECDELTLLVEGVGLPTSKGVQIFNYSNGHWRNGYTHTQSTLWKRWVGFKHSLRHNAGIEVEESSHWWSSIQFISSWYAKNNNPTSTTMTRYVIPHMPPFDKDPQIDNLCRMKDVGIREITATKLIGEFGSIYGVMTAGYAELVGLMGGAWTRTFFEAIGRET